MEILIIIAFLVCGVVLLLAEIFIFPGISFAGIAGFILLTLGVVYAFNESPVYGTYAIIFSIIALILAVYYIMRSRTLDKLSLHTELEGKIETVNESAIKVGDKGKTVSRLAPMGKVRVNNLVLEAKSQYDFIDENTEVEVTAINNTNVEVKQV